jgi:3-oxoacyl-[acyl-carrier protein] reductase
MLSLEGKTALVTGASGDIGAEIVRNFHKLGAKVIISGTNKNKLDILQAELGDNIFQEVCNLSKKEEVAELYTKAELHTGKIDILVCNAGITKDNLLLRMSDEDFDDVINVNLTSSFILNKAAVKKMMKQKWGRIINISSIVGVTGNPGQANYCASKAGLIGMTKSIALEIATRGITVNAIAPGFISTAMTEKLNDEQKEYMKNKIPLKKFGTPLDIAHAASYLASDMASYITGQTIHVNGGMFMS